jgi:hypothetical protein
MENQNELLIDNPLDIQTSKPSTSRFFFLLGFFGFFIFAWAGCYSLYTRSFQKADVPVNESSLITGPKYK